MARNRAPLQPPGDQLWAVVVRFDVRVLECAADDTVARVDDLVPSRNPGRDLAQDRFVQFVRSVERHQAVRHAG